MNRYLSLALILGGAVLIVMGVSSMDSFHSDVSRFFEGTPTDGAVWMLIGGIVMALSGISGAFYIRTARD